MTTTSIDNSKKKTVLSTCDWILNKLYYLSDCSVIKKRSKPGAMYR